MTKYILKYNKWIEGNYNPYIEKVYTNMTREELAQYYKDVEGVYSMTMTVTEKGDE